MVTIKKRIREKVGKWSRKGMPRRSKEMWHINKRNCSLEGLEQMRFFVKKIIENNWDGKKWRTFEDAINRELGRANLTSTGPRLSTSALGTLRSVVSYFGFIKYKDGSVYVTEAGKKFANEQPGNIESFKLQLLKLQFTNPIIKKYCQNLHIFPIRAILRLLLDNDVGRLTREEIGYIIFHKFKKEEDFMHVKNEILQFRKLEEEEKKKIIDNYLKTPEGSYTLKKAPAVEYLIGYMITAKLIEKSREEKESIFIPDEEKEKVKSLLKKFNNIQPFDFGDDIELWLDYYGDPETIYTPQEYIIEVKNEATILKNTMASVSYIDRIITTWLLSESTIKNLFLIPTREYSVRFFNLKSGEKIREEKIFPKKDEKRIIIFLPITSEEKVDKKYYFSSLIRELINSKTFDKEYEMYLENLKKLGKIELTEKKFPLLRGGRLEFLFYKLLQELEKEKKITNLRWNGKESQLGLKFPAPGGKEGIPDILFSFNDKIIVLEITTITSQSSQWQHEASSVPFHLVNIKKSFSKEVVGIFAAPKKHEWIDYMLRKSIEDRKIKIITVEIERLINIFLSNNFENEFMELITSQTQ
jgi:hypothetical protein